MEFSQLLTSRRSIRNFENKSVPVELITQMIKESTLAPNAGNQQTWKFIIVNNIEMIQRISSESKKNILDRIAGNPNDYAKQYETLLKEESDNRTIPEALKGREHIQIPNSFNLPNTWCIIKKRDKKK
ncbi:MAG: hypothetical protein GY729_07135 [Desulfobacteraceae bacterium]|nr:hypothetical protein [Desulfobacteraceae bacterium]